MMSAKEPAAVSAFYFPVPVWPVSVPLHIFHDIGGSWKRAPCKKLHKKRRHGRRQKVNERAS
jgi:hypothetical protein